ncbi:hypothetical protein, partial [Nostoc sp. MG11]|uniref:hypothetical protein n=1 Tax=Nostoc sp. MG11 TaxID=2721166 RepID=UPI00186642C1
QFVLQNGNEHFYIEGETPATTKVEEASRYPTFADAQKHLSSFHNNNKAVDVFVRPVRIIVQLLD